MFVVAGIDSMFATSAYEGLVEIVCLVAIVVEFADGNMMHTLRVERKNMPFAIRHFETVVIEIVVTRRSGLKLIEGMYLCHLVLKADYPLCQRRKKRSKRW